MTAPVRWPTSAELIPQLAEESDGTCLLSFSGGKDALAAWLALRPHFPRIIPVFFYCVPGLEFVERSLQYYEAFFGTPIIRLPHPQFLGWLDTAAFQPPHRLQAIAELPDALDEPHWDDYFREVRRDADVPPETFVMNGVRAADSMIRRTALKKTGPVNRNRCQASPIWDWTMDQVRGAIVRAGVALPIDYQWFGRSFDGIYFRYLEPIKRHAPKDYATICEWFPLAPAILARGLQVYGRGAHA